MGRLIDEYLAGNNTGPKESVKRQSFIDEYLGEPTKDDNRLDLSVKTGAAKAPEVSAQVLDIQKKTGLPADFIERNLDPIKQKTLQTDAREFRRLNPKTGEWLAESPYHASIAQDDLENLGTIERLTNIFKPVPALAASNIVEAGAGAAGILGFDDTARKWREDVRMVQEYVSSDFPLERGSWSEATRNAFVSIYTQAPSFAVGLLTGGSTLPLTMLGTQSGLQKTSELMEGGISKGGAVALGTISGLAEALTEKIPFDSFIGILKKDVSVGKGLLKMIISEQFGEQAATGVDTAIDKVSIRPDMGWEEYLQRVTDTAKSTLVQTSVMGGSAAGVQFTLERAQKAQQKKQLFEGLGKTAEASKLRERSPEAFEKLVERLTENGPIENVYIPVEAWNTYWQGKGADPKAIASDVLGETKTYEEAILSGTDMVIPTAKYARKLAVIPEYNAFFADEMRTDPLEMSAREAREFAAKFEEERTKTEAEGKPAPTELEAKDSAAQVGGIVAKSLMEIGFDEPMARTQAQLYESRLRRRGQLRGEDPLELFKRYGLKIQRAGLTPTKPVAAPEGEGVSEVRRLSKESVNALVKEISAEKIEIAEDGTVKLTPSKTTILGLIRGEIEAGEAGGRHFREGEVGGDQVVTAIPSTFPDYFQNKGYTKAETLKAIDKAFQGKKLGKRQRRIVEDLYGGYMGQVRERLKGKEGQAIPALTDTDIQGLTDEEFSQRYFQTFEEGGKDARGRITFGPGQINIEILRNADLSTFLHETGHLWLNEVADDVAFLKVKDPAALTEEQRDFLTDSDEILKFIGAESWQDIKTEHHETWARGIEAYLRDGQAPSEALRSAFARFKAWLLFVYEKFKNLNVSLAPEVRDVMDRLLATREEIANAQAAQGIEPLFKDMKAAGMSEKTAARYAKGISEARAYAEEELAGKLMGQVKRELKVQWREEREAIYNEVKAEVESRPVYIALSVLQAHKGNLPEGIEEPYKLSKKIIVEQFGGEERLKKLPKPHVYSAEGGAHPDEAAGLFGYSSGEELLNAIENAEDRTLLIGRLTDERMKAKHGDLMNDGTLPEAAMAAIHNEKRSQLLLKELEYLASEEFAVFKGMVRKVSRRIPPIEAVRAYAERTIATKKMREISPYIYQRAERQAARKAVDALLKGEIDLSFNLKLMELYNHELYRAAVKARDGEESIVEYMKRFDKTSVRAELGKAGGEYLTQIDAIREHYDFRWAPLKEVDKRKSLSAWVKEQEAQGLSVHVPIDLLEKARLKHYREATYEELIGLRDAIKNIEHLAKLKNELLASEKRRSLEDTRNELVSSIGANHTISPETLDLAPGLAKRLFAKAKETIAAHTKMEFLFEFLDGNKAGGPAWEILFKPIADAEAAKTKMTRDVSENLRRIFGAYSRAERASWFIKKTYIPEIRTSMTKANMLALALNQGNEYNRMAVKEGKGFIWSDKQVQAVLSRLDKRDWDTVQAVWDYIDTFWPEIKKLEEALSGIAPAKVQPVPVMTKFGTYRGGYYPIIFDPKYYKQTQVSEAESVQEMFGGQWARTMTRHGHTIERKGTGGKPILLELTGLADHIEKVTHDLAFRRAIMDVDRLTRDEFVKDAIIGAAGQEMYKQLRPWLRAIATDRRETGHFEGLWGRARTGATIVNMGWKLTTAITQVLGYTVSINELGVKYSAMGLRDAFTNPFKLFEKWAFITERSEMMKERPRNYDRDVRDVLNKMNVVGKQGVLSAVDAYTVGLKSSWFATIAYMDLAVSIPTWLGAYRKAMDGQVENIESGDELAAIDYADRTVRVTQSAGAAKDLANIQRGPELWRLFTMFYSYFSVLFNQFGKTYTQFRMDRNVPKLIASLFLLWFVPAILDDLLTGRGPDDEDDDEAWARWFVAKELMYPFQSIVLARDFINGIGRFGYEPSAAFDAVAAATKAVKLGVDLITGDKEELERGDVKNAVMLVGYFAQLPTRQIWTTAEYFHDWMTGEEEPESPVEGVWRGLVTGKKRD